MGEGSWVNGRNCEIFSMLEQNETNQGLASSSWERMLKIGKESGKSEWPDSLSAATSLLDRLNGNRLTRRYSAASRRKPPFRLDYLLKVSQGSCITSTSTNNLSVAVPVIVVTSGSYSPASGRTKVPRTARWSDGYAVMAISVFGFVSSIPTVTASMAVTPVPQ